MDNNRSLDTREKSALDAALSRASMALEHSYLGALKSFNPPAPFVSDTSVQYNMEKLHEKVRFFDVARIVLDKSENMRDKLVSVFNSCASVGSAYLLFINGTKERVTISVGVRSVKKNDATSAALLEKSILSNFPGTSLHSIRDGAGTAFGEFYKRNFATTSNNSDWRQSIVSAVTGVARERRDEDTKERRFVQGIERVIDAMRGEEYSMLLIADPVSTEDLNASRRALENIYSSLVPFCTSDMTMNESESEGVSESLSKSVTRTITTGTSETISHTHGTSSTQTEGTSSNTNINPGAAGAAIGAIVGSVVPGVGTVIGGIVGGAIGGVVSFNKGKNQSHSEGVSNSDTTASGVTNSQGESTGTINQSGKSSNTTTGRSLQLKFENHSIKRLMEKIDATLKRYDECADLGMFNCAMYCVADSPDISARCASLYQGIIRGKDSSLDGSAITTWNREQSRYVLHSLLEMRHPVFDIALSAEEAGMRLTAGSLVSSAELAIHAGLPYHSVPGIPVIECAPFGRSVSYTGDNTGCFASLAMTEGGAPRHCEAEGRGNPIAMTGIALGNIFHMHSEEEQGVNLSVQSLASHTFITGSTGAGKTNTVCVMLDALRRKGVHFLVVEPAKGEYKDCFAALAKAGGGGKADVSVYGTNPAITPLLRINPFSFEAGIHPLEHLDRLIEVFNVCWPMYAAMPAVLKEAVEKSYKDVGWDLTAGVNKYAGEYGRALWPCFADVCRNVRTIIDTSEYDAENKGAYKGSLVTRLKSLSNGINGMVFTDDEIPAEVLFDSNVIADLSRVGSMETKALIMGLLVLKLQEHRMTQGATNAELQHVTVLEEAHNLLKRTSTEQTTEGANLIGKSVEMLTNAIAEMRSFGEGFVIADQAPGLLDMAAIRNTNTKIIMRLPDQTDRELVGKAAALNDDQITELAKLPRGVAAVYQNEWVEAVLCKVKHYDGGGGKYERAASGAPSTHEPTAAQRLEIARLLLQGTKPSIEVKDLQEMRLSARSLAVVLDAMSKGDVAVDYYTAAPVVAELFGKSAVAFRDALTHNPDAPRSCVSRLTDCIRSGIASEDGENMLADCIVQAVIVEVAINELHLKDKFNALLDNDRQKGVVL